MNLLIKQSIPNFITLSNLFLGFTSMVLLSLSLSGEANHYINTACYLILISSVLDVFDGKVARKLNISSEFGKEIDSLADLVSFCMVPSFLTFVYYKTMIDSETLIKLPLLILFSSFPLIFGAIRLAKYNTSQDMRESDNYLGLPTPANAILICSLILFIINIEKVLEGPFENMKIYKTFGSFLKLNEYNILFITILNSILLMSKVDYEKFPLISFKINRKNNLDLLRLIIFLAILFISIYFKLYELVLVMFMILYIYGNLVKHFLLKLINYKKEV